MWRASVYVTHITDIVDVKLFKELKSSNEEFPMNDKLLLLIAVAALAIPSSFAETENWTDFVIKQDENRILYKNYQPTADISQDAIAILRICLKPGSPAMDIADGPPSAEGVIKLSVGAQEGRRCVLVSTRSEIRLIGSSVEVGPNNTMKHTSGTWKLIDIIG